MLSEPDNKGYRPSFKDCWLASKNFKGFSRLLVLAGFDPGLLERLSGITDEGFDAQRSEIDVTGQKAPRQ